MIDFELILRLAEAPSSTRLLTARAGLQPHHDAAGLPAARQPAHKGYLPKPSFAVNVGAAKEYSLG